jgi:hypothetical protein
MRTRRRTNLVMGMALLAAAAVVMLNALNLLPASVFDLLVRAWPALLVLAGLSLLLRARIPLGSLLALIVTLALAGGVATLAYYSAISRSAQQRSRLPSLPVNRLYRTLMRTSPSCVCKSALADN